MKTIMKAIEHFRTVNHHRKLVRQGCFKVGLYRQGILHDLSKYSPAEFLVGCKYYQGDRSPNNAEREDIGYSSAWLHHKGRNKHHYEYWLDYSTDRENGIVGQKMPVNYVVEMCMDRIAASKTYLGDAYTDEQPLLYYRKGAAKLGKMIHPQTAALLRHILEMLARDGEEKTFSYIRKKVLKKKRRRLPFFGRKRRSLAGWKKKNDKPGTTERR